MHAEVVGQAFVSLIHTAALARCLCERKVLNRFNGFRVTTTMPQKPLKRLEI